MSDAIGSYGLCLRLLRANEKKKKKQNESQSVTSNRAQHAKKGIKGRNAEKSRRLQLLLCTKVLALSKEKKNLREK